VWTHRTMPPVGMQARASSMIHQSKSYGSKNHDQNDSHEGTSPPPPHPRRCDMQRLLTPLDHHWKSDPSTAREHGVCDMGLCPDPMLSNTDAICAPGEQEPVATLTTRSLPTPPCDIYIYIYISCVCVFVCVCVCLCVCTSMCSRIFSGHAA
jgi:hypothetical protein